MLGLYYEVFLIIFLHTQPKLLHQFFINHWQSVTKNNHDADVNSFFYGNINEWLLTFSLQPD